MIEIKSAKDFLKIIPEDIVENIFFRQELHTQLANGSQVMRDTFVDMCREKPQITFKTAFWTFQTDVKKSRFKNLPFVTWPIEDEVIDKIIYAMRNGRDELIRKSRDMGASWTFIGCGFNEFLFMPETMGLVTSRKKDYVDKKGNPDCLFWKFDYLYKNLPEWLKPEIIRTDMHIENLWNGAVIDGETTNVDVGRGGRRQWVLCDEFAAVDPIEADGIQSALSDTTPCRLFNSTPSAQGHPFGQLYFSGKISIIEMLWWKHPFKARGLYYSPDINVIIIEDIDYYRKIYPEIFNKIEKGKSFNYSELEKELLVRVTKTDKFEIAFIADGGREGKAKWRSPWYDAEEARRTPQDMAQNVDGDFIGAGDMVFSSSTLQQLLSDVVRQPEHKGEVTYSLLNNKITKVKFQKNLGRKRLWWWGELAGSRPPQNHNYVIGCDISLGQGQSNSVASIYDCDTHTKVGSWVCSNTLPTAFAEQVYALGKWIGGTTGLPFLIWEASGIGMVFGKRIRELGYDFVYRTTTEKPGYHKRKKTVGWFSNSDAKLELISNYNAALTASFNRRIEALAFTNYDEKAIREAQDYVFYEKRGLGPSKLRTESGGAKAAHGDRVIADALCCLARDDQPAAARRFTSKIMPGSFAYRRRQWQGEDKRLKENKLWLNL